MSVPVSWFAVAALGHLCWMGSDACTMKLIYSQVLQSK